jgi:hypothetical protein
VLNSDTVLKVFGKLSCYPGSQPVLSPLSLHKGYGETK